MTEPRHHPWVDGSADSDERINAAMRIPKRLHCHETGRVFEIIEWAPIIRVDCLMVAKCEVAIRMPEEDNNDDVG